MKYKNWEIEFWSFLYSTHPNFRWIFTITRKIKIRKLIFHSIQHIAHLSLKWEGGVRVCIYLVGKKPNWCYLSCFRYFQSAKIHALGRILIEIFTSRIKASNFSRDVRFDQLINKKYRPTWRSTPDVCWRHENGK